MANSEQRLVMFLSGKSCKRKGRRNAKSKWKVIVKGKVICHTSNSAWYQAV